MANQNSTVSSPHHLKSHLFRLVYPFYVSLPSDHCWWTLHRTQTISLSNPWTRSYWSFVIIIIIIIIIIASGSYILQQIQMACQWWFENDKFLKTTPRTKHSCLLCLWARSCYISTPPQKALASKRAVYSMHRECEVLALGRSTECPYASTAYQTWVCKTVWESTEQRRRYFQIHHQHVSTSVKSKNLRRCFHWTRCSKDDSVARIWRKKMTSKEGNTWRSFRQVVANFLGNNKSGN